MSQRNIPFLFYAHDSIVNGANGIAYSSSPSVVLWVKFGSSGREMIDAICDAFHISSTDNIVHMTSLELILLLIPSMIRASLPPRRRLLSCLKALERLL
ncbi:hypothetical protein Syun_026138 [Stephania yunnanensis]|uniref:Uncharacterized protein n=1 Tax=Stephania yunnanensis TaxID=152371 RepID=A0AAP0EYF9_9MAGN